MLLFIENFDFDIQGAGLAPGDTKRGQGGSCALRCISLDFSRGHGLKIASDENLSLAERANRLAKHAIERAPSEVIGMDTTQERALIVEGLILRQSVSTIFEWNSAASRAIFP
jgi:hypothetical protein